MGESDYDRKMRQELSTFEQRVNVHDLPEIFYYWFNTHILPMCEAAGFTGVVDFFASELMASSARTGSARPRFLSLGAGNCDTEIAVAALMRQRGCQDFSIECVEINPAMLQRGKELAAERGLLDVLQFTQSDFNAWVAPADYDGVMANQALHHVTELERLFGQLKRCIGSKGRIAINDVIGRNGHQRWPESLAIVHRFWQERPHRARFNLLLQRHEELYENWDCSVEGFEGIRAQEILPLLLRDFHCEKFVAFGSAIDVFVDRAFGHHFDPANDVDRDFIDRVHRADEEGFAAGTLTPTHMFGVFTADVVAQPCFARGLEPAASIRLPS
jgi:SAM-dependent methyltransferase